MWCFISEAMIHFDFTCAQFISKDVDKIITMTFFLAVVTNEQTAHLVVSVTAAYGHLQGPRLLT